MAVSASDCLVLPLIIDDGGTVQELSRMASRILLACAALQFPQYRVRPTMRQFIELLRRSSSWRVRLDVLLPLQGMSEVIVRRRGSAS